MLRFWHLGKITEQYKGLGEMAKYPGAEAVYEVARLFRERCLVEHRSFLWPDEAAWTTDSLQRLWDLAITKDSIPSLIEELKNQPPLIQIVAVDVLAAGSFFRAVKRTTQERDFREFLDALELPPPDPETWSELERIFEIEVPGSFTHYKGGKFHNYLSWLFGLKTIVSRGLAHTDRDTLVETIRDDSESYEIVWDSLIWGMLHTMFPEHLVAVPGDADRKLILHAFSNYLDGKEFPNDFAALDHLRKTLPHPNQDEPFDFYEPSLVNEWGTPKHRRRIEGLKPQQGGNALDQKASLDAEPVYEAARLFRVRCIENDLSFLWPDMTLWTPENLVALWNLVEPRLQTDQPHKKDTLSEVIQGAPPDLIRIAADLVAFARLYPSLRSGNKRQAIEETLAIGGIHSPSIEEMGAVWAGLQGHVPGGRNYHWGTIFADVSYHLRFVQEAKPNSIDIGDAESLRDHADAILHDPALFYDGHRVWTQPRHTIMHLFRPDRFVGVTHKQHRTWILDRFSHDANIPSGTDEDTALDLIRSYLSNQFAVDPFDFYADDIKSLWFRGGTSSAADEPSLESSEGDMISKTESSYQDLVDSTHLSVTFLQDVHELLQSKRQLIFEGPPGSGKTFVAEKFARWFTGQPVDDETALDEHVEIVQFHQSYGYEDFVQGIRPETNSDGQIVYRVRDGIFLDMVERAKANPEDRFVLIIDEINRGNLSRIFGELLLLLEYRGQSVRLPYGSGDAAHLTIPENLYLIGTMNTADRSLAQIDYALRRRFYFVRFMPVENGRAEVFENWLARNVDAPADRQRLADTFVRLNHGIRHHLGTDDLQIGHSYFMQDGIETEVVFERVWRRAVRPLLEEYLHHHRRRDEILADLLAVVPGAAVAESLPFEADATEPEQV